MLKLITTHTEWASGTHDQINRYLHTFDWSKQLCSFVITLCLTVLFCLGCLAYDSLGFLLIHLCMARARHGIEVGGSLDALSKRYGLGVKGKEVLDAIGKRRARLHARRS